MSKNSSSIFVSSQSPCFFHCMILSYKHSTHLHLTTFNQHVAFLKNHYMYSFIQFQFSIKLSSMPGNFIIIYVISVLGDSLISINQNYKDMILGLYIKNCVCNCSLSLLGGSSLCSMILFEVW